MFTRMRNKKANPPYGWAIGEQVCLLQKQATIRCTVLARLGKDQLVEFSSSPFQDRKRLSWQKKGCSTGEKTNQPCGPISADLDPHLLSSLQKPLMREYSSFFFRYPPSHRFRHLQTTFSSAKSVQQGEQVLDANPHLLQTQY